MASISSREAGVHLDSTSSSSEAAIMRPSNSTKETCSCCIPLSACLTAIREGEEKRHMVRSVRGFCHRKNAHRMTSMVGFSFFKFCFNCIQNKIAPQQKKRNAINVLRCVTQHTNNRPRYRRTFYVIQTPYGQICTVNAERKGFNRIRCTHFFFCAAQYILQDHLT